MLGLIGIKLGMTQIFTESGDSVAVTVIELPPATIMGLMTAEKDGYKAIKITSGEAREKNMTKAIAGQFKSAGVAPGKHIAEFRLEDLSEWSVGKKYDVSIFASEKEVTITGTTKGRGFAGTIKRHKFQRGPTTHGSQNTRQPGSIGAHTYPGRVFPGQRMAGHHGDSQQTTKNLDVIKVDVEKNLLFVRGAVPGHKNSKVIVRKQ
jgi:large subunit ribosomal protein L3